MMELSASQTFEERRVLRKLRALKSFVRGSRRRAGRDGERCPRHFAAREKSTSSNSGSHNYCRDGTKRRREAGRRADPGVSCSRRGFCRWKSRWTHELAWLGRWSSKYGETESLRDRAPGLGRGSGEGSVVLRGAGMKVLRTRAGYAAPHSLSPTKHRGQEWDRREVEVCAPPVLMTLRNLCVVGDRPTGRVPSHTALLTCLRFVLWS